MTRTDWPMLLRLSVTSPRQAARLILAMELPVGRLWEIAALLAALTTLLLKLMSLLADPESVAMLSVMVDRPLLSALFDFGSTIITALALLGVGNLFGGKGDWRGSLALVVWLQVVVFCLSAAQLVLMILSPFLGGIASLASMALQIWLMVCFAAELHGFRNLGLVFLGLLISGILVGLGFITLLGILGVPLDGAI